MPYSNCLILHQFSKLLARNDNLFATCELLITDIRNKFS